MEPSTVATPFEFSNITLEEARAALDATCADATCLKPAFVRLPPRPEDQTLQKHAADWLDSLPPGIRPIHCAHRYPRIVNRLARLWAAIPMTRDYLSHLLLDDRGGRQGFPVPIAQELTALRYYYDTLHPEPTCIWAESDRVVSA
jgi:hypothetical protein